MEVVKENSHSYLGSERVKQYCVSLSFVWSRRREREKRQIFFFLSTPYPTPHPLAPFSRFPPNISRFLSHILQETKRAEDSTLGQPFIQTVIFFEEALCQLIECKFLLISKTSLNDQPFVVRFIDKIIFTFHLRNANPICSGFFYDLHTDFLY